MGWTRWGREARPDGGYRDAQPTLRLLVSIDDEGIGAGDIGVIVAVFNDPDEAYEVEFGDQDGATVAQVVLKEYQFEVVAV
tara:strand:- start:496 stop:738 length:243 start_codon:yes stop_codon:yes gene_type:complete